MSTDVPEEFPWAERVDLAEDGESLRIPWLEGDGEELHGVIVRRSQVRDLIDILEAMADAVD